MKKFISIILLPLYIFAFPCMATNANIQQNFQQQLNLIKDELNMEFIIIKAGCFFMGSPDSEKGRFTNETLFRSCLSKDYLIAKTEITQKQWTTIMAQNPAYFSQCGEQCPVESISWNDIQQYLKKLSQQYSLHFRLPTEQQWEFAARAGNQGAVANHQLKVINCDNDENLNAIAWYCFNSQAHTHPVAQKKANAWGLYDMQGNVWEWVADIYQQNPKNTLPPEKISNSFHVFRGGSIDDNARAQRLASRRKRPADSRQHYLGFRLLIELDTK